MSANCGAPLTVTGPSKVTVAVTTSVALSRLFCIPLALVIATVPTTGAVVSTVMAAAFCEGVTVVLPATSVWRTRTEPGT